MALPPTPPLDIETMAELARRFAERRMLEEAADLYLVALRLDPKNLGLKLALSQVRRQQKTDRQAAERDPRETLREDLRRNAIDAAHFLGLAHLYAEKGETARAVECLDIAKAKDLANPAPFKLLGRLQARRGDHAAAATEFSRALRFNPFDRETAESLARAFYETKEFRGSLEAAVDAFLLLHDADEDGAERIKRRVRTLKQILKLSNQELVTLFHERQEKLRTAFDRLEWRRELFREEDGAERSLLRSGSVRHKENGQIDIAAKLRRFELLAHLSDEQIFLLSRAVRPEAFERGAVIFANGSTGFDLYLLERGEVTIRRPTAYGTFALGILGPGELFGEVNFISRYQRSGDAVASAPCQLLMIDAVELEGLVRDQPELGVQLYWSFWHGLAQKLRGTNEQLRSFFNADSQSENFVRLRRGQSSIGSRVQVDSGDKIRLFREQGLSGKELESLATFSRERRFTNNAHIFQEGEKGNEMYVVLEGRVRISKYIPGGGEEALAILERGDFFGEMALIDGQPRSADARAHGGPAVVLALDQPTVHEVLSLDPQAALDFLQLLCRLVAKRLREIDEKVIGWRIMSGERTEEIETA